MRQVRGVLFVDYVRMLRRQLGRDFVQRLTPDDQRVLSQRIEPDAWYPMATFERMGLLILQEIVGTETDAIRLWGRQQVEPILEFLPELHESGEPRDSVMRFAVFLSSLFDFPAVTVEHVDDESAVINVTYGMSTAAEQAAVWQTTGFFEALITKGGGGSVESSMVTAGWVTGGASRFEMKWVGRASMTPIPVKPKVLVVDDEVLVGAALERILQTVAEVTVVHSAAEAVKRLEKGRFDTVLSDFNMPGTDGLQLLGEVRARWPEVRCVLHSSDVPEKADALWHSGALDEVLHKPAPLDVLRKAIRPGRIAR